MSRLPISKTLLPILHRHAFTLPQIHRLTTKLPSLLNPSRTLPSKLTFLLTHLSPSDLTSVLTSNPSLLLHSLRNTLAPALSLLPSVFPSKPDRLRFLRRCGRFLTPRIASDADLLRSHGVPDAVIRKLFLNQPRAMIRNADGFREAVENVTALRWDPRKASFTEAVAVVCYMKRETWERKLGLFRGLGWTPDELVAMFTKQPSIFNVSDDSVKEKVEFFKRKLGWNPEFLVSKPVLLKMSFTKRIVPRCAVLKVLMKKGVVGDRRRSAYLFLISEKVFAEKFVEKYREEVPEVVEAYEGKLAFDGWTQIKIKAKTKNKIKTKTKEVN